MSSRRRAVLLAGLALLMGGLAASDVASREAALRRGLGPLVPVVVARTELPAGVRLEAKRLAVRRIPARFAPRGAVGSPGVLTGLRLAVAVSAGTEVMAAMVRGGRGPSARAGPGAGLRRGERVAEVLAVGAPVALAPGARVDVLVTRDEGGAGGGTVLALQDVEVLGARPGPAASGESAAGAPRVLASLRVTLREAVYLAAAQAFARELRLLPRAAGDHRRSAALLTYDADLASATR